jgi:hypothetical protein
LLRKGSRRAGGIVTTCPGLPRGALGAHWGRSRFGELAIEGDGEGIEVAVGEGRRLSDHSIHGLAPQWISAALAFVVIASGSR